MRKGHIYGKSGVHPKLYGTTQRGYTFTGGMEQIGDYGMWSDNEVHSQEWDDLKIVWYSPTERLTCGRGRSRPWVTSRPKELTYERNKTNTKLSKVRPGLRHPV